MRRLLVVVMGGMVILGSWLAAGCSRGGSGGAPPAGAGAPIETSLESRPAKLTNETAATFVFSSNVAEATFEANLDDAGFVSVPDTIVISNLSEGEHQLEVRAVTALEIDSSPAQANWTVDTQEPDAVLLFPPPRCLTDSEDLTVTGTASDEHGVEAVQVNGVSATSPDGFDSWTATVPLSDGTNAISITVDDAAGNRASLGDLASVENERVGAWLRNPAAVAYIPMTGDLVVIEGNPDVERAAPAILAVDPATGDREIVADAQHGTGPELISPVDLAVNDKRVFVTDPDLKAVLAIDLATRERSILSSPFHGSGPGIELAGGLAVDSAAKRAWVIDEGPFPDHLLEVDLSSGDRSIVSDGQIGEGPDFVSLEGIDALAEKGLVFVTDTGLNAVMKVDVRTGDREIVSDEQQGTGPGFSSPRGIRVRDAKTAYVMDKTREVMAIVEVDLDDGDRRIVSDGDTGFGPKFESIEGMAYSFSLDQAFVSDSRLDALVSVDVITGDRRIVSQDSRSLGPDLEDPSDMIFGTDRSGVYLTERAYESALFVDLETGVRTLVSDASQGDGPLLERPHGLARSGRSEPLYATADDSDALLAIDPATGDRRVVSDDTHGAGPGFDFPIGVAARPGSAFVVDAALQALVFVSLSSGDRSIISDENHGEGPELGVPWELALREATSSVLLTDRQEDSLVSVDLEQGDRTVVSGPSRGSGPELAVPLHVSLEPAYSEDEAFVTTWGDGRSQAALLSVDLETGDRQEISGPSKGLGPPIQLPYSPTTEANEHVTYLLDSGLEAVVAIELQSGDRVLVSW